MAQPTKEQMREILTKSQSYADPEDKEAFHRVARTQLRKVARLLPPQYGKVDPVRSNKGGIAVSGEVTLHAERVYVQVSQSCMGLQRSILYRTCDGLKDYSGGQNNFANIECLLDPQGLCDLITRNCKV